MSAAHDAMRRAHKRAHIAADARARVFRCVECGAEWQIVPWIRRITPRPFCDVACLARHHYRVREEWRTRQIAHSRRSYGRQRILRDEPHFELFPLSWAGHPALDCAVEMADAEAAALEAANQRAA